MMRPFAFAGRTLLLLLAIAAVAAAPAEAQRRGTLPAWQVGEMTDGISCFTAMEYEGGVLLMLVANMGGRIGVAIGSPTAPDEEGRNETLRWQLGARRHAVEAVGIRSAGRKGHAGLVNAAFRAAFARASTARIQRGNLSAYDTLSLKGSADGVRRLGACVERLRERARRGIETRDLTRLLLNDPLRRTAPYPSRATANLSVFLSHDDYPASALRAEEQGRSRFRLEVGADGRVSTCTIVESSGSTSLDSASCRLIRNRARFVPARDGTGNPVADTVVASILWRLPDEPPRPPPPTPPPPFKLPGG